MQSAAQTSRRQPAYQRTNSRRGDCSLARHRHSFQLRQRNGYSVVTIAESRDTSYTNSYEALDRSKSVKTREFMFSVSAKNLKKDLPKFPISNKPLGNHTQSVDVLVAVPLQTAH
jgi:hypothetical protein